MRGGQRAQIIERQDVRDQVAELEAPFENPHQQRNLQAHQDAHGDHQEIQRELEAVRIGEGQKQRRGRESADHAHHQLDRDEPRHQRSAQISRRRASEAHREQIRPDDGRELQNAVAEQIAGERSGDQLINEPAGGDQQDGEKKKRQHAPGPDASD